MFIYKAYTEDFGLIYEIIEKMQKIKKKFCWRN